MSAHLTHLLLQILVGSADRGCCCSYYDLARSTYPLVERRKRVRSTSRFIKRRADANSVIFVVMCACGYNALYHSWRTFYISV